MLIFIQACKPGSEWDLRYFLFLQVIFKLDLVNLLMVMLVMLDINVMKAHKDEWYSGENIYLRFDIVFVYDLFCVFKVYL